MASASDFCLIADEEMIIQRCRSLCVDYSYSFQNFNSLDAFMEASPKDVSLIVMALSPKDENQKAFAAEMAQSIRFSNPDTFTVCTVSGGLAKDEAGFAKKSGANLILLKEELMNTSKPEFISTQIIKSAYLPIKSTDLTAGKTIPFTLFHLLPQRGKFLPIAFPDDLLDEKKMKKCIEAGELYIRRMDAEKFDQFIKENQDQSASGLSRRCRSQFLMLFSSFSSLVFLLTDQSEGGSFAEGQELLKKCTEMCSALLGTLGEFGNACEIINNSAIGELGSVERAPAVAAYAAVFGLRLDFGNIDQIMLAALLVDLGLILIPPSASKKLLLESANTFSDEEKKAYHSYPQQSMDLVLNRKLSLDQKFRTLMMSTQERADGKGFPKGLVGSKISDAAQLVQFCREFDQRTLLRLGKPRPDYDKVKKDIIMENIEKPGKYNPEFLDKLKKYLIDS